MWWQALIVLMQGAAAGVPFWAILWAIDRLRGGDGTRVDSESLDAAWRAAYDAEPGPEDRGTVRAGGAAPARPVDAAGLREAMEARHRGDAEPAAVTESPASKG